MVITDTAADLHADLVRVTLVPTGEIDAGSIDALADSVHQALRDGAHEIDVDLAAVTFMDTAALAVLEGAREVLQSRGGFLCLRNPAPPVGRLLQLAALVHGR